MRDDRDTGDYEIGYKKPPKSGQFKKGVSGNPLGRPKKASDFGAPLIREFNSKMTINENGQRKVVTKWEVFMKQLVNSKRPKFPSGTTAGMRTTMSSWPMKKEREADAAFAGFDRYLRSGG
jgi:hypothetical protein